MNAYMPFDGIELWHIAGWTMIHFLWLGAIVALATGVCRLVIRRAAPHIRYAVALAGLLLMAALPPMITAWLLTNSPPLKGGARGGVVVPADLTVEASTPDQRIIELSAVPVSAGEPASAGGQLHDAPASPTESAATLTTTLLAIQSCVPYFPCLWLFGTPITFTLLATGMIGTRRLRNASCPIDNDHIVDLCAKLAASMHVTRQLTVAVCERVAAPVLVGILRPIILLPPAALTGWSPDEIEMVLLHELAHVRRWDNLANLMQRLVESLLFFHPAVWLVSNWVRREREACCDALVVRRTNRPHAYAEMLVALAAQMPRSVLFHPAASSAMAAGPLRARIRRILQLEDDPMLISGRSFTIMFAGLVVAATLSVLYLPTIGQAEESATEATESTEAEKQVGENAEIESSATVGSSDSIGPKNTLEDLLRLHRAYQDLTKEWPSKDIEFASSEDRDTATFAWYLLKQKLQLMPATEQELKSVRARGYQGGLKIVRKDGGTAILTQIQGNRVPTFMDLRSLLLKLHENLPEYITYKAIIGTDEFDYAIQMRQPNPPSRFPPLEDQKLADLAWKHLELELEPLGEAALKRVKKLGYDGGVAVTGTMQPDGVRVNFFDVQRGDILVGLHVWPTTSLKSVADILNRDDLAELIPLKFYVVRHEPTDQSKDIVITGRIKARLDEKISTTNPFSSQPLNRPSSALAPSPKQASATRPAAPANRTVTKTIPAGAEPAEVVMETADALFEVAGGGPIQVEQLRQGDETVLIARGPEESLRKLGQNKVNLRYEGKTFAEWRDAWRTELSTEKRSDAINAIAAFGAHGYGKEAAETILEVVKQYDWNVLSNTPAGKLKKEAIVAFAGRGDDTHTIPWQDWLPVLTDAVRGGDKRAEMFAQYVIPQFDINSDEALARLIELSRDASLKSIQSAILQKLGNDFAGGRDPRMERRLVEALSEDAAAAKIALRALYSRPQPGMYGGGGYGRGGYGGGGRGYGGYGAAPQAQPKLEYRPEILEVLKSDDPDARQVASYYLSQIGPEAKPAVPRLFDLLFELEMQSATYLAAVTIPAITGSDEAVTKHLNKVAEEGGSPDRVKRAKELLLAVKQLREQQTQEGERYGGRGDRDAVGEPSE